MKSPVGLKITGPDLQTLSNLAERAAALLKLMPQTASERGLFDLNDPVAALPKSAEYLDRLSMLRNQG